MCGNELKKGESVILIDILHLIKIFLKAAKKKAPKKVAEKFVIIFLKFLTWRTLVQAKELWLLMSKYFGLKNPSSDTNTEIQNLCEDIDQLEISQNEELYDEIYEEEDNHTEEQKGIRKISRFKFFLQKI